MTQTELTAMMQDRLGVLANVNDFNFIERVLAVVNTILQSIDLPPKKEFLASLEDALVSVFATVDTPGPDMLVEPIIKQIILSAAAYGYDQIQSGVEV
jgi:hypothetical protein